MLLLQLIGPLLVLQGIALGTQLRRAPLRPPPADEDPFALALAVLGGVTSAVVGLVTAPSGELLPTALSVAAFAAAAFWVPKAYIRREAQRPHAHDLKHCEHAAVETIGSSPKKTRLVEPGSVGGVTWPAGTLLAFRADGSLARAVPPEPVTLGGVPLAGGEPIAIRPDGQLAEVVPEEPLRVGRLPRGPTELRGAEVWARPGSRVEMDRLRGVTLAHPHHVRGVDLPAGSVLDADRAEGSVRVRLAAPTTVFGHPVPSGSVLSFAKPSGLLGDAPDVEVELGDDTAEGYRDPSGGRVLRIDRDGSLRGVK